MAHEPDEYGSRRARFRNIRRRESESPWLTEQADDPFECVAKLTPEQREEVKRRVEAHAARVERELAELGLDCKLVKDKGWGDRHGSTSN